MQLLTIGQAPHGRQNPVWKVIYGGSSNVRLFVGLQYNESNSFKFETSGLNYVQTFWFKIAQKHHIFTDTFT